MPPFIYKIISCRNGTQNKFVGRYRTIEEAYDAFEELKRNDVKLQRKIEAINLQFADMVKKGCTYAVMEVSSHALEIREFY